MADWNTSDTIDLDTNITITNSTNGSEKDSSSYGGHSRESSRSSGMSFSNKENQTLDRQGSVQSASSTLDNSSERDLILLRGSELKEESGTESHVYNNFALQQNGDSDCSTMTVPARQPMPPQMSWSGSTAKERAAKSPYASSTIGSIPEEDVNIPYDANISAFTNDQLANFLRCLKVDDRIISHLHRKSVDGKRFSRLKDSELENLGMKNPVIVFFRDKSNVKLPTKKGPFML